MQNSSLNKLICLNGEEEKGLEQKPWQPTFLGLAEASVEKNKLIQFPLLYQLAFLYIN